MLQPNSLGKANDFICVMTGKYKRDTARLLNKQGADQVDKNTQLLDTLIEVMKYLRGTGYLFHQNVIRKSTILLILTNPGNFLALLDVIAKYDAIVKKNHSSSEVKTGK